ncbi:MAG TPA: hypothetical protein VLL08_01500 [Kineosporiaceae bacterium]|nr:hypothetical protein [Kineosporiaceae bacterium]
MRRGEVWWAQFDEQYPVVLLEDFPDDGSHQQRGMRAVQIVAASGVDVSGLGREVAVGTRDDLPFQGVVRIAIPRTGFVPCTWVTTVGATDLVERIGTLSPLKLAEIDQALAEGDGIVSDDHSTHDAADSTLAAIRKSLRAGTIATRQIARSSIASSPAEYE